MSRYYRMKEPGRRENLRAGLVAGGVAAAVAAVSFYLTRLFVSREPLEPLDSSGSEEKVERGTPGGGI
jgi:hypothetical protein